MNRVTVKLHDEILFSCKYMHMRAFFPFLLLTLFISLEVHAFEHLEATDTDNSCVVCHFTKPGIIADTKYELKLDPLWVEITNKTWIYNILITSNYPYKQILARAPPLIFLRS